MNECVFCRVIRDDLPKSLVWEDDLCIAIMDIQPVNPGHVLVIPKEHVTLLQDVDDDVCAHLLKIGKKVGAAIRKTDIEHEALCYFLADGDAAGQEIPHVHLHVFPRYRGDGFKLLFPPGYMQQTERAALDKIAEQIKTELS